MHFQDVGVSAVAVGAKTNIAPLALEFIVTVMTPVAAAQAMVVVVACAMTVSKLRLATVLL